MKVTEDQIVAHLCRASFYEFVREFWSIIIADVPIFNWHIEKLCNELQEMAERVFRGEDREYDYYVLNVPPGTTKSTLVSQMFSAWVWTRMPHAILFHISYSQLPADKDAIRTRDVIRSDKYKACFPEIEIREDMDAIRLFGNTKGGRRRAFGMDASITGDHAHFIITDDPLDPQEALSDASRKSAIHTLTAVLPNRTVNAQKTAFVLCGQRTHQADPTAQIIADYGKVRHICLPAELTPDVMPKDWRYFYKDGLLDPVRFPRKTLDEKRKKSEYEYSAQYLQTPVPAGGGSFDVTKLNRVPMGTWEFDPRQFVLLVRAWDKAGSIKKDSAWSVGVLMGKDKYGRFWILNVVRGKWKAAEREAEILKTAHKDAESGNVLIVIEQEPGSGGLESAEKTIAMLAGFNAIKFPPTGDKEARAYPLADQVGSGNVYILERFWTKELIEEMRFFPHSRFKDQVDAMSLAFGKLHKPIRVIGVLG